MLCPEASACTPAGTEYFVRIQGDYIVRTKGKHTSNMQICRIAVEQQLRTEAEHEVAETWKKVNSYRRQLKEAEMEADSMASRKDHTAELKEKCLDLEDRFPICCLPCLGLHFAHAQCI